MTKQPTLTSDLSITEKFEKLSMYKITLIRRHDDRGHWRLGLNRESEDSYVWVVERPTIEECLNATIEMVAAMSPNEFLKSLG